MRVDILVIGGVLAIAGIALWDLPLAGPQSQAVVYDSEAADVQGTATFAYLDADLPWSVSWSANASVFLTVFDCGPSLCNTSTQTFGWPMMAQGNGTSGSLHWRGPRADWYAIVVQSPSGDPATLSYRYSAPFDGGSAGIGLVGLGVVVAIVGAASPRRPPKTPSGSASVRAPPA